MSNISGSTSISRSGGGCGCLFYCTICIVYFILTIGLTYRVCWWVCCLIWWKLTRNKNNNKHTLMIPSLWNKKTAREEDLTNDPLDEIDHNDTSSCTSSRPIIHEEEGLTKTNDVDHHDGTITSSSTIDKKTTGQESSCFLTTAATTSGMESSLTDDDERGEKERSPFPRRGKQHKIRMTSTNKTPRRMTMDKTPPNSKMITNSPTSTSRQEEAIAASSVSVVVGHNNNEKQTTITTSSASAIITPSLQSKTPTFGTITKPTSFMKETTKSSLPQRFKASGDNDHNKESRTRLESKSNTEMRHSEKKPCFVEHKLLHLKGCCKHEDVQSSSDITIKTNEKSDNKKKKQQANSSRGSRSRSPPKRKMVQELQTYNKRGRCESPKQTRRTCHKRGRCAETPTKTRNTTPNHYHYHNTSTSKRIKIEKLE